MTERSKARIRLLVVVLAAFALQVTVASDLRIQGVAPDFLLLAAICAGLTGGGRQGALLGFFAGLLADLYLTDTPVGLSAMAFCLVGYGVGAMRENVLHEGRVLIPVLALVATAGGVVVFVGAGDIVGQTQLVAQGRSALIRVAVVESIVNAVLALPATWIFARAARGSNGAASLDPGRSDSLAGVR